MEYRLFTIVRYNYKDYNIDVGVGLQEHPQRMRWKRSRHLSGENAGDCGLWDLGGDGGIYSGGGELK
jgi:hypothetical protein